MDITSSHIISKYGFFAIFLAAIGIAYLVRYLIGMFIRKRDEKKDDTYLIFAKLIHHPTYILMIFSGIYFTVKYSMLGDEVRLWFYRFYFVALAIILSLIITRILTFMTTRWLRFHKLAKTTRLINMIITVITYLMAFLLILNYFSVELTPIIATLGIGGLAIGLALQTTLSNFFADLSIISDRPFGVGDYIELLDNNLSGYIEDIGWRSTRIRTLPDNLIIIPNAKLVDNILINTSLPSSEMGILIPCRVAYASDLKKVEKVAIDVAKDIIANVPGAVKTFEPFIRFNSFGDSNIDFNIIIRVEKFTDKFLVTHEFIKSLKERFDKEKIEISLPARKIHNAK